MMTVSFPSTIELVLIGVFATAALDLWALMLNRISKLPMTNWGYVGRWVGSIPSGTFRHQAIAEVQSVPYERAVGWSTHYVIGIAYAAAYLGLSAALSATPSAYTAALFGIATVLAPWLILQPGLGLGYFASRSQNPNLTRVLNVAAHLVFGLGLYLGWRLIADVG